MDNAQVAWLGLAGAIGAAILGALITVIWQHRVETVRRKNAVRLEIYLLLLELNESYFWIASASLRNNDPPSECLSRCYGITGQIIGAMRRLDTVDHLEEIVAVLLDISVPSANERANRLGELISKYGKLVNPKLAAAMQGVSRSNVMTFGSGRDPKSWAPGQVHMMFSRDTDEA